MSTSTAGPYVAGSVVTVATWYLNQAGLLVDGWKDRSGNPADPTSPTLKWWPPDGSSHVAVFPSAPVVRSPTTLGISLGLFQADLDTTGLPGQWQYQWQAPQGDVIQSLEVGTFYVRPARG